MLEPVNIVINLIIAGFAIYFALQNIKLSKKVIRYFFIADLYLTLVKVLLKERKAKSANPNQIDDLIGHLEELLRDK